MFCRYNLPTVTAKGVKVAIFGGSFNPPHSGHVSMTLEVISQGLVDEVWWLISPQNPLKDSDKTLDLAVRKKLAKALITSNPRVKILSFEEYLPDNYTVNTLKFLKKVFKQTDFYLMIGSDNWLNFYRWKSWREIINHNKILILTRPDSYPQALSSIASRAFKRLSYNKVNCGHIYWRVVLTRLNYLSSTKIRKS